MVLFPLAPSMLEKPVLRKFLGIGQNIKGSRAYIVDRGMQLLYLIIREGVAILLRVNLGMI